MGKHNKMDRPSSASKERGDNISVSNHAVTSTSPTLSTSAWMQHDVQQHRSNQKVNFTPSTCTPIVANSSIRYTWQRREASGLLRCLACNKICDGNHEVTSEHVKKLEDYLFYLQGDYATIELEWLAWLECPDWGPDLYLKCLVCDKWVQDTDGTDNATYAGAHGILGDSNSKNHKGKLTAFLADPRRTGCLQKDCEAFPELTSENPSLLATSLPAGWSYAWSDEDKAYYYYDEKGISTWTPPLALDREDSY